MSINSVNLSGNLTRDPVLKYTNSGKAILELGMAVNDRRKNQQTGEWEDNPCYVDCVMFGTRAESVSHYLTKGSKLSVNGKLNYSSWKDKDTGKTRSKLEVVVNDLEFMSGNQAAPQPAYQPQQQYAPQYQQQAYTPMQQAVQPIQQTMQHVQGAPMPQPVQAAPQPMQVPQPMQQPVQQAAPQVALYDEDIPF